MNRRSRVRSVTPLLVVSDIHRSVDFYCQKLGFIEPNIHGEPPCFAMMNRDGFDLMLSLGEAPDQVVPHGRHGVWDMYISVADVAAEQSALEAAGVAIDKGPTDAFYDMRELEVLDPDGHRICFAQDISDEAFRVAEVWEGVLDVEAAKFRLVLKLAPSNDGLMGLLDSPDQKAMNQPIDQVSLDGTALHFQMKAIDAHYEGEISEDGKEMSGRWSQRGQSWPLAFLRV